MDGLSTLIVFAKATVLAVGLLFIKLGYRAFQRTRSRAIAWLTIAMALITLGEVMDPGIWQMAKSPSQMQVFDTALTTAGFLLLGYSVYVTDNPGEAV